MTFGEFGPGDNIGLISAKLPATAIRGQFYGIAAAIGKLGAFTGAYAFTDVSSVPQLPSLIYRSLMTSVGRAQRKGILVPFSSDPVWLLLVGSYVCYSSLDLIKIVSRRRIVSSENISRSRAMTHPKWDFPPKRLPGERKRLLLKWRCRQLKLQSSEDGFRGLLASLHKYLSLSSPRM